MEPTSLKGVLDDDKKGELVLPDFQRDFVWNENQQKSLIATFLVKIPINSMLLLQGNQGDFAEKKMCWKESAIKEESYENREYLLDGQQRLSTLKSAFSDLFEDKENWKHVAVTVHLLLFSDPLFF